MNGFFLIRPPRSNRFPLLSLSSLAAWIIRLCRPRPSSRLPFTRLQKRLLPRELTRENLWRFLSLLQLLTLPFKRSLSSSFLLVELFLCF